MRPPHLAESSARRRLRDPAVSRRLQRARRAIEHGARPGPVRDPRLRRRPARSRPDPPLRLVPAALARAPLRVGQDRRPGSTRGRLSRGLDHAGLGRRARRGVPRHEGGEPRHQRRHDPRRAPAARGGRARAPPDGGRAAHRHERPRGRGDARGRRGQPEADPRRAEEARRADADRAVPGVPELRCREAAGRADPGPQRAVPGGGEERRPGHGPRDLAALRRPERRRDDRRVPRPAASQRDRLREVGGGAAPRLRDPAPLRDRPRPLHPGGGLREPVQRPRSHRLGLSPHFRGGQGERHALAGLGPERRRLAVRHRARPLRRPERRRPTGASPPSTAGWW